MRLMHMGYVQASIVFCLPSALVFLMIYYNIFTLFLEKLYFKSYNKQNIVYYLIWIRNCGAMNCDALDNVFYSKRYIKNTNDLDMFLFVSGIIKKTATQLNLKTLS